MSMWNQQIMKHIIPSHKMRRMLQILRRDLETMSMKDSDSVDSFTPMLLA